MADRRTKLALAFAIILTAGYSYQIVIAVINHEPTSPVWYVGLVCGIGLILVEASSARKKMKNDDVRSNVPSPQDDELFLTRDVVKKEMNIFSVYGKNSQQ